MTNSARSSHVPVNEQAEALLRGRLRELRERHAPGLSQDEAYRKLLTLTHHDIVQHLSLRYKLNDFVNTEPSRQDGYYAVRGDSGYHVYLQEREVKMFEASVVSEEDVWAHYAGYLLQTSGTGLRLG